MFSPILGEAVVPKAPSMGAPVCVGYFIKVKLACELIISLGVYMKFARITNTLSKQNLFASRGATVPFYCHY